MALKINTPVKFDNGVSSTETFVFLNIYLVTQGNEIAINYYLNQAAWKNKLSPMIPADVNLQTGLSLSISKDVFWGNLSEKVHLVVKQMIEKITGENTVEIIEDPLA